ncbi:MAG: hypothetical protein ACRD8A_12705 [Candidatus Acidiferrales bacterium]
MHVFHRITGRKPKGGMHIKPSHEGLFTREAHAHGRSIQGEAQHDLHSPNASGAEKKRANFARMARRHFKPL